LLIFAFNNKALFSTFKEFIARDGLATWFILIFVIISQSCFGLMLFFPAHRNMDVGHSRRTSFVLFSFILLPLAAAFLFSLGLVLHLI
jgi:hypothetical protein